MTTAESSAPKISASFVLSGDDFDADACSNAIGLLSTDVWRQSRPELRDRPELNNMNWSYGIEITTSFSTNDVVAKIVGEIWSRKEAVLEFAKLNNLSASLCCNITIHENRSVYELMPETMRQLADLNAEFLIDIFDYSQ